MKIGLKFRCYPDSTLQQLIHQTAGNNRFIYNYFLKIKSSLYKDSKASLSYNEGTEKRCEELRVYFNEFLMIKDLKETGFEVTNIQRKVKF